MRGIQTIPFIWRIAFGKVQGKCPILVHCQTHTVFVRKGISPPKMRQCITASRVRRRAGPLNAQDRSEVVRVYLASLVAESQLSRSRCTAVQYKD